MVSHLRKTPFWQLALQALATSAGFVNHDEVNVRILFSGLELNQTFDVTQENRLVLQKQEGLPIGPQIALYERARDRTAQGP